MCNPAREKATNNMMLWHNSILLLRCGPAAAPRAYHLFPAREKVTNNMRRQFLLILLVSSAVSVAGLLLHPGGRAS